MRSNKNVAWVLMSGGFGSALMFLLAVVVQGIPHAREWFVYIWPACSLIMGMAGWTWLRRLYRAEPPVPPAAWTVTLSDLIQATLFAGCCGVIASLFSERLRALVPVMGMIGMALYVHGALAASLRGIRETLVRPFFVIAHILLTLGAIGVVTLVFGLGIMIFSDGIGEAVRMVAQIVFGEASKEWMVLIQVCVRALPVGVVMMAVVRWRLRVIEERD